MKVVDRETASQCVIWVSTLLIVYLSYRYPFQINFSGTSETYSDTPFVLQLTKYAIAVAFCVFLVLFCRPQSFDTTYWQYLSLVYILAAWSLVKATMLGVGGLVDSAVWPLIASVFVFYLQPMPAQKVLRYIGGLYYYCLAWDLLQITLFFVTDRLPALAWGGTFSVRFGSFLDDPNGFSAMCFLFFGWASHQPRLSLRWLHTGLLVLMILASQSLTSIGFLLLLGIFKGVEQMLRLRGWMVFLLVGLVTVIVGLLIVVSYDFLMFMYELKENSISDHVSFRMADLFYRSWAENLFGAANFIFYEAWWVQSLVNFGPVWMVLFFIGSAYVLYKLWYAASRTKDGYARAVYSGGVLFAAFMIFGGVNLPFYTVFPVNFIFYMLAFMVLSKRIVAAKSELR